MTKKVFIHTNNKQILGAKAAKYSIEKNLNDKSSVQVEIINVDEMEIFKNFHGKKFKRGDEVRIYDRNDLQSFTLSRFMPPELMNYQGMAIVIDPDIFALCDINELFDIDLQEKSIAACRKKNAWDSSVMLLNCEKLKHWKIEKILNDLENFKLNYMDIMTLRTENPDSILEIPRIWNSLDVLNEETKLLHTTKRLTQPWKTGLKIDFTINKMPKIFGIIPREPIYKMLKKYPTHYLPHPNKNIEKFFFSLVKEMLEKNIISENEIRNEIDKKHIRKDAFHIIESL